jgi:hypothetical protein
MRDFGLKSILVSQAFLPLSYWHSVAVAAGLVSVLGLGFKGASLLPMDSRRIRDALKMLLE